MAVYGRAVASLAPSQGVFSSLALFLVALSRMAPVLADCECGYATNIDDKSWAFTDLIETDFSRLADISTNTDWIRQAFNITSDKARGDYGEMFAVDNIYTDISGQRSDISKAVSGKAAGLQLSVGSRPVADMVPVSEIDSARTDILWGSFRASIKVTDTPGTCSAFFWVSDLLPVSTPLGVRRLTNEMRK